MKKDDIFIPDNARLDYQTIHESPSGKYHLIVTPYATGPGTWNYTHGVVHTDKTNRPIAEIRRNYSAFPFAFVEGHPNGHDYLICGEDYQGQTVIELDTGKRVDRLPEEAKEGFAFCWAEARFDITSKMLVVSGCHWGGPYEFLFYDFSDPMNGWPEIEADEPAWDDPKWPYIEGNEVRCYETESWDSDDDEPKERPQVLSSIQTFKRDGLKLNRINEWVSEAEKVRRQNREEGRQKYELWKTDFQANDPLYIRYRELLPTLVSMPENSESIGVTYEGWCPHFHGNERRWCRRLMDRHRGRTVDLEWAAVSGPVKLVIFQDGNHVEDKFFEHSVDGMTEAFAYAQSF